MKLLFPVYVQSDTKISRHVAKADINEVLLNTICLHKNVNINFSYLLNNLYIKRNT